MKAFTLFANEYCLVYHPKPKTSRLRCHFHNSLRQETFYFLLLRNKAPPNNNYIVDNNYWQNCKANSRQDNIGSVSQYRSVPILPNHRFCVQWRCEYILLTENVARHSFSYGGNGTRTFRWRKNSHNIAGWRLTLCLLLQNKTKFIRTVSTGLTLCLLQFLATNRQQNLLKFKVGKLTSKIQTKEKKQRHEVSDLHWATQLLEYLCNNW